MRSPWCLAVILAVCLAAAPVRAEDLQGSANPSFSGISTSAPHGGGLLPSSLFDPTRFSISNSLVFGYASGNGYGVGNGSAGLFTSSLGYRLKSNMALHVDVGAHMNPAFGSNEIQKGIFLQGAAFDWRPSANSLLRVEYRDIRSPLQNSWGSPYGYAPYGYAPYGSGYLGDPMRN